jgi:hypothetical protein
MFGFVNVVRPPTTTTTHFGVILKSTGLPHRVSISRQLYPVLPRTRTFLTFLVLLCQHRYFLLLSFDDRYLQTNPVVAN